MRVPRRVQLPQEVGNPCGEYGATLVLCVQCGANSRCLTCTPYERPSARDEEEHRLLRAVRARPEAGLLAGALAALPPAMLLWAGATFTGPGPVRTVATLAGAVACATYKTTAFDRWRLTGEWALLTQLALLSLGVLGR